MVVVKIKCREGSLKVLLLSPPFLLPLLPALKDPGSLTHPALSTSLPIFLAAFSSGLEVATVPWGAFPAPRTVESDHTPSSPPAYLRAPGEPGSGGQPSSCSPLSPQPRHQPTQMRLDAKEGILTPSLGLRSEADSGGHLSRMLGTAKS